MAHRIGVPYDDPAQLLDPVLQAEITRRWGAVIRQYGYELSE